MRNDFESIMTAFINEDIRERRLGLTITITDMINEMEFHGIDHEIVINAKADTFNALMRYAENPNGDDEIILEHYMIWMASMLSE